jgi:hypothetical protein
MMDRLMRPFQPVGRFFMPLITVLSSKHPKLHSGTAFDLSQVSERLANLEFFDTPGRLLIQYGASGDRRDFPVLYSFAGTPLLQQIENEFTEILKAPRSKEEREAASWAKESLIPYLQGEMNLKSVERPKSLWMPEPEPEEISAFHSNTLAQVL